MRRDLNLTRFSKRGAASNGSSNGLPGNGIASNRVPAVTVITATYNGVKYIDQAIRSILRQTWTDFEFLIIDDASTDRTAEIIKSYGDSRIRVLHNDVNLGVPTSLNRGLAAARGALVAIQDHDDISHPERLNRQVAFMMTNPDLVLAGTQTRIVNDHGQVCWRPGWSRPLNPEAIRFQSMFDNPFIHSTVIFRREIIWDHLGGYDEKFITGHDYDLMSRVAERYMVRNLSDALFDYRVHDGRIGKQYGSDHAALSRTIVKRNLCAYLNRTDVPEDWTYLISGFHIAARPSAADLRRFFLVAEEIYESFLAVHPEEKNNRQIQRVMAAKLSQVACKLAPTRPLEGVLDLLRAGRSHGSHVLFFVPKLIYFLLKRDGIT